MLNFSFIVTLIGVGAAYQITFNKMLSNLPWDQWHFSLGKVVWFWTVLFGVLIIPLVLLRSMGYFSLLFFTLDRFHLLHKLVTIS